MRPFLATLAIAADSRADWVTRPDGTTAWVRVTVDAPAATGCTCANCGMAAKPVVPPVATEGYAIRSLDSSACVGGNCPTQSVGRRGILGFRR